MQPRGRYQDLLGVRSRLRSSHGTWHYYSLTQLCKRLGMDLSALPTTIKILLEAVVRNLDGHTVVEQAVHELAAWKPGQESEQEIGFKPARVLMQDLTGVPAVVDLAALRDALLALGGEPADINPGVPVDLVIDHSIQVDRYASCEALAANSAHEFVRNRERYEFLKWGSQAFGNFRVVPPATGIVHQVNLECLAAVVWTDEHDGLTYAFPDTLVGTDSHTTMINGLGVLGWGVGGIEAEAVVLDQPLYLRTPQVIGIRLLGQPGPEVTATDIVLTITQSLRKHGVVGKFIEFYGPGVTSLDVEDRATISNMSPEYGATASMFPVDERTLAYLVKTGRPASLVDLVERYTKEQQLFVEDQEAEKPYSEVLEFDLSRVERCIAGPKRPQDRISLREGKLAYAGLPTQTAPDTQSRGNDAVHLVHTQNRSDTNLANGSIVIAAITSCTNTSNPSVMVAAGLVARKAVERGLQTLPHVKTSLAPGSRVVTRYLERAGLTAYLEALGFHLVGYGCTTCIGNSGPLDPAVGRAIAKHDLTVAAVLSGNRNFEGRIHPEVRVNYLASPPLVVAYALAGRIDVDLTRQALAHDRNGEPVYLKDLWPTPEEIRKVVDESLDPELYRNEYRQVFAGNETWEQVAVPGGKQYNWSSASTYIRRPPFFEGLSLEIPAAAPIDSARVLLLLGDSVTTDHISPAGAIPEESPAANWLREQGIKREEFNTYGSRRGNHEVMMRGTFGNIRIRNGMVPEVEGGYTLHIPSGQQMFVFDAAARYRAEKVPLIVLAGKEYGAGSSRDWAAKGTFLLGVRAVIAESYERIHRSNLIGMGVLPLQFSDGQSALGLGLTGTETYSIERPTGPRQRLSVTANPGAGSEKKFTVSSRIDTAVELDYYRNGGILHTVLRRMAQASSGGQL